MRLSSDYWLLRRQRERPAGRARHVLDRLALLIQQAHRELLRAGRDLAEAEGVRVGALHADTGGRLRMEEQLRDQLSRPGLAERVVDLLRERARAHRPGGELLDPAVLRPARFERLEARVVHE